MIMASVKGFGPGPYEDCKVYENVAQCAGGAASTTGFRDGVPLVTGAQIGDSGTGLHLAFGICAALLHREKTGRGQRVLAFADIALRDLSRAVDLYRALNYAISNVSRPDRSRSTRSTGRASRLAKPRRVPVTIPEAVSPGASSSARAGRRIPTRIPISSPRRRYGRKSAT